MQSSIDQKLSLFIEQEGLPKSMLGLLDDFYLPLVERIAQKHKTGTPLLIGVNGGQGSGKSTTSAILCLLLQEVHGLHSAALSIDDLYLTKEERMKLAKDVHPLFITRGVPGTHDTELCEIIFNQVSEGLPVTLPVFDKLTDDRANSSTWHSHEPLDVLILEGWCVGCTPQDDVTDPINQLEREEDSDALWRGYVNDCLKSDYAKLFYRLDMLLMLAVPSMEKIYEWRELQEQKMEQQRGSRGMSPEEVKRFIMHYERLTRWMLKEMPQRCDILVPIGDDHAPKKFVVNS